ncbi:hypothetical protein WICPIJ_007141 [Wickerhamomyces pijperi]|uniref:Uncharacterized protein n=1 Tax=Wickerhamomyces pijperi TaxID=599730 RepID=A0A9P8Q2Z3_WICPI|nr:hypothetical protein WICPIJ_007141 [Wickerhamomyces pijperi]
MEQNETNVLNLFRFASKKKSITEESLQQQSSRTPNSAAAAGGSPSGAAKTSRSPSNTFDSLNIDTAANDDSYPPESYYSSAASSTILSNNGSGTAAAAPSSPTESSLIFERSVEDPSIMSLNKCPRCERSQSVTSMNDPNFKHCPHQSITNLPSHFSMENYVSPCLDASTELLTDKNANLDNVEMVYSRRPSTVLLSAALGRSKSDLTGMNGTIPVFRSQSLANIKEPSSPIASNSGDVKPPLLSFYSYADIINNENPNPRRPSITQSLSSSFIRSNSMSSSSIAPQRTPQQAGIKFNQSPFARNPSISRIPPLSGAPGKFQLDTSPNSSDSESDYITSKTPIKRERTPSRRSMHRTKSNASGQSNFSRNTTISSPFLPEDDEEEFVVSSVGDHLRKNTGEIRSRHNSIHSSIIA